MPQASDELRAKWPGMDAEAISHLEAQGYQLTRQWTWIPPSKDYVPTERDHEAVAYLIFEWDFGGVERGTE